MPDIREMQCEVCGEIFPKEELAAHGGLCIGCSDALDEASQSVEARSEDLPPDSELKAAVQRYIKRRAYMREYNSMPKNKAKRKEYNQGRAARDRMLIRKAKEKGLLDDC